MSNRTPKTWQELQNYVAYYFNCSGYEAITPYKIKTVRGEVEVDVFVKIKDEIGDKVICECKYWDSPIPQEKVHAFRTVINDSGVSLGIIISKNGFQRGSYLAASNSNVKLLTWNEFLESLFDKWFSFRRKQLLNIVKPLAVYTDIFDVPTEKFSKEQEKIYKNSLIEHTKVYMLGCSINKNSIRKYNELFQESIETYEEFFDKMAEKGKESVAFYEEFFSKFDICDSKFEFCIDLVSRVMK